MKRSFPNMLHKQRGVVLMIALIMLVAMSLGGIAILRSVDTSTLIAGNLAFKQRSLVSTDLGIETAIKWITDNRSTLNSDNAGAGYFSSTSTTFEWYKSSFWNNAKSVNSGNADAAGNVVSYIIHRLCILPGQATNAASQSCAYQDSGTGVESGQGASAKGGASQFNKAPSLYLRIVARSVGPRNSVSYAQAMVLLPQ